MNETNPHKAIQNSASHSPAELQRTYARRSAEETRYRAEVWQVLTSRFFSRYIGAGDRLLDLGCAYGEFINSIRAGQKYAMDMNPHVRNLLAPEVTLFEQDCTHTWPLDSNSLDVIFSSNFFEHLPDRRSLLQTLAEAHRCLRPCGRLIAMGPNLRFTGAAYWDFFDHYLPLTERSMADALGLAGFQINTLIDRFLPYTIVKAPRYPLWTLKLYLKLPLMWRSFGKQFLVVASKLA